MNQSGFKQRLIGAAVLIALAVLFLPVILDGKKAQYFEEALIPSLPEDNQFAELGASLEASSASRQLQSQSIEEQSANISPQTTPELSGNETWFIVQVASFADESNAKKLVARLKSQHLKAFKGHEKVIRNGQKLSRVLVGPMLLKGEAEAVLKQLKDNKDLKPSIVEYDLAKHSAKR